MRSLLLRPRGLLSPTGWLRLATAGYLALLANALAWPLWYSPGGPYEEWMLLKTLPLLPILPGLLHGRRRSAQWATLLALPYIMGSVVAGYGFWAPPRFTSEPDAAGALLQGVSALALLAGAAYYAAHPGPALAEGQTRPGPDSPVDKR